MAPKNPSPHQANQVKPIYALIDLIIFLAVMFGIREVYIEQIGFWGNTILRSVITLVVATALLYLRKQSWKNLGLVKPNNIWRMLAISVVTFVLTIICILVYKLIASPETVTSAEETVEIVRKSLLQQIFIICIIYTESFFEELQDRGFSLNRFQSLFGNKVFSAGLAVIVQAAIFGFRHSYDLSERSITTGLIGLIFGALYVMTGRNLWPFIIAHILLNTMSLEKHL